MRHYTIEIADNKQGTREDYTSLGEALKRYDELTKNHIHNIRVKISERVLPNEVIFTAQKDGQSVDIKLTIWT